MDLAVDLVQFSNMVVAAQLDKIVVQLSDLVVATQLADVVIAGLPLPTCTHTIIQQAGLFGTIKITHEK